MTERERRLAEFVDRHGEMRRFSAMLDGNDKRIMLVWGDSGLGKSSLLARMIHEASLRRLRKSELVWTNTRRHDYLAIMRKLRDDAGAAYFNAFTDLLNYFTVPRYSLQLAVEGDIAVASGARFSHSQVGDMAGVVIKDSMFVLPRADVATSESERMIMLTNHFLDGLASATMPGEPFLVFFDAVEKMSPETHDWLWGELIQAVRDERLPHVRFVLCGHHRPVLARDVEFLVEDVQLKPLGLPDIIEYLGRRGVEEASRKGIAQVLIVATGGNPLQVASLVDAALKLQAGEGT